ncbi:hypothetical protein ACS0TY_024222 [Phlomoides rotata]
MPSEPEFNNAIGPDLSTGCDLGQNQIKVGLNHTNFDLNIPDLHLNSLVNLNVNMEPPISHVPLSPVSEHANIESQSLMIVSRDAQHSTNINEDVSEDTAASHLKAKKKIRKKKKKNRSSWEEYRWTFYEQIGKGKKEAQFCWDLGSKLGIEYHEDENVSRLEVWSAYMLKEKLKALKFDIKEWIKGHVGNLDTDIANMSEEIGKLDAIDDTLGLEEEEISERNNLMKKLSTAMNRKEAKLIQKAKIRWAKEGDLNSALFHKVINMRSKRNNIDGLWAHVEWKESVQEKPS